MKRNQVVVEQSGLSGGQNGRPVSRMATMLSTALLGAVTLLAMPLAQATVNFDSIGPDIYGAGDTFSENKFTMSVLGDGFAGAILDGADPYACFIAACPVGNSSHYYAGLNDSTISFARSDAGGFKMTSLDFAFLAPVTGNIFGGVGRLQLSGVTQAGGLFSLSRDFPEQINGAYAFSTWALGPTFSSAIFRSVSVNACLFDGEGGCVLPSGNQAQFALDNVNVSAVPEPATYAMMGLGLMVLAGAARRRRSR
ncbi:NF038120 family PEP-CTERM protein [Actimicrobium antarcticum]|uniref:Ice-binding protein C-terminal domain-containing protein n=1 Tax=Actimicrobium antarcticum TaxID=1051899 RepID=A0ABP7TSQ1_9BURK